jgi:hypothetical protein
MNIVMSDLLSKKRWWLALVTLFAVSVPVRSADVLPSNRRIDWSFAGVSGGIPYRTTIYQTLSPGATAAQINTALANCPSNQVVFLNAGTYSLSSKLSIMRNGVTLRGAVDSSGMPATILNFSSGASGDGLIDIPGSYPDNNNWSGVSTASISSGYSQGSTSITLSSTPSGLVPGYIMVIDQLTDEVKVRNQTTEQGSGTWGGRNGNRGYCQFVRVKSVNGTSVTFEPPLYGNYWTASLSPQIYWWGRSTMRSGIEDLQVNRPAGGAAVHNLHMTLADSCWVRNVKSRQCDQGMVRAAWTLNCEIRDCYFTLHDSVGSATYSIFLTYCGSALAQNNIGYITPCFIGMGQVMGSVVAYNYATNFPYSVSTWLPECVMLHGGHNYYNLFEGNIAPSFWADIIHGNASYITVHRNKFTGWEPGKTGSLSPANMDEAQDYFSFMGNVLGTSGIQGSYGSIWNINSASLSTVVRKGNYNTVNNSVPSTEALGSDTLSTSYYLPSRPSWFGSCPWPPIDPSSPASAVPTNTPAGYRFVFGKFPTAPARPAPPTNLRVVAQ